MHPYRTPLQPRYRRDHASLFELLVLFLLVLVIVMVAFDALPFRVIAFFHDLLNSV